MPRTGRPKIQWDAKQFRQFETLCAMQCTYDEIESVMENDIDTISRICLEKYKTKKIKTFSDIYKKFAERGKVTLRRNQLRLSEKNAAMAIFLGKNWLGQKDGNGTDDINDGEIAAVLDKIKSDGHEANTDAI